MAETETSAAELCIKYKNMQGREFCTDVAKFLIEDNP